MSEMETGGLPESAEEAEEHSNVELIDVQTTVRRYLQCLLDDLELQDISSSYIPLRLRPFRGLASQSQGGDQDAEPGSDTWPRSTSDILPSLEGWERIVLLGRAGAGKTATLRWLAHQQAERLLTGDSSRLEGKSTPVQYLPLCVELPTSDQGDGLVNVLAGVFEKYELTVNEEAVGHILHQNAIVFLFDGLERIRDNQLLDEVARSVESGNAKCVVACRTEDYGAYRRWLEDPHVLELEDMDEEERRTYIQSQLPESARPFALSRARGEEQLWNLLRIPLFSTTFVELAEQAANGLGWVEGTTLVEEGVRRLLEATSSRLDDLDIDEARRNLAALALQMQRVGKSETPELGSGHSVIQLGPPGTAVSPQWLSSLASTGIIGISKAEDTVWFADSMVQDYFAALAMSESYTGALSKSICLDSEETAEHWEGVLLHLYHFLSDRLGYLQQLLQTRIDGWGPRIAAKCLAYNEDSDEARQLAASLALVDTLDLTSVYRLGVALKGLGKTDDAAALFEGMLGREREDPRPRQEMLGYREKYGRSSLDSSRPAHPETLISRRNLGLLYRELDQVDRAVTELEEAAQGANAACSDTYHELGLAYLQQGRLEDALTSFQHAIALSSGAAAYHYSAGVVLNHLERYAEAQAELQQATMLEPEDPGPYLELGFAYEKQEWYEEALAAYQAAEARDAREPLCPQRISRLLSVRERWDEAAQALRRALALAPNKADWHYELGALHDRRGQRRDALAEYLHAADLDPKNPDYLHTAGALFLKMNRPAKAIDYLCAAVDLDSGRADWCFDLASAMASQGRNDEAWVWSERSVSLAPDDPQHRALAGRILRQLGRRSEAESQLRQAAELDPQLAVARCELGLLLDDAGRRDEALAEYEAAIALDPEDATHH
ncbi:MAG: tetratricopeptide repeat protein, partial [Anaerolineae bacterium]